MTIRDIDHDVRKINSIVLRVFIVLTLIYIYSLHQNYFTTLTYITTAVTYFILLCLNLVHKFDEYKGKCRLILDLTIIGVFLFGKDLNHTINYFPFVLLLFNAISHSNKYGNILIFIVLMHVTILAVDKLQFHLHHHLIPIIFYIFYVITFIRRLFNRTNESIILAINNLFINNVSEYSSHDILKRAKFEINTGDLKKVFTVKEIFLFSQNEDRLALIKGSKFIKSDLLTFSFEVPDLIEDLKSKTIQRESYVVIDEVRYNDIYWIKHNIKDQNYYFLLCLGDDNILSDQIVFRLFPIFDYIVRLFHFRNTLFTLNTSTSKAIKEKITYVLDAQNALHFVKNKLSPITTTLDLVDRYFKTNTTLTQSKKEYIEKTLKDNNNNLQIKLILAKAEVLIRGVDNIISEEDKQVSIKQVIDDFRSTWRYHFNNIDHIIINIDNLNLELMYNHMLFEFVFTDIIENINKYAGKEKKVAFIQTIDSVIIHCSNSILNYERNKESLKELENLYNLKDNDEIYNRKTHGLNFIRRLLRRKGVENRIYIDTEHRTFNYEIILKMKRNEDPSL